jgi:1-aminocyclopropane-1-carboxylate deaminase/D-cysteine desulfhydrase-like pyridoxal-dependent ACC family enzyme
VTKRIKQWSCPRLTKTFGGPEIFVKRDDLTGLAFGGNKTRQLEFLFAEIMKEKPDAVAAGAYTQSIGAARSLRPAPSLASKRIWF